MDARLFRITIGSAVIGLFGQCALALPPQAASRFVAAPTIRLADVAKVKPNHAAEFERTAENLPSDVARAFERHGFRNHMIFVKELSENEPWAFRYVEYQGGRLADDLVALADDPQVHQWQKSLDDCLANPWADTAEVFHTNGQSDQVASAVTQFGQVVGIRRDMIPAYRLLHAHPWPEVLAKISEGNIRNYSIYLAGEGEKAYLFAYFEYVGTDFDHDMQIVDRDAATQAWMKFTDEACQLPIPTRASGEWWANMKTLLTWQADRNHDH